MPVVSVIIPTNRPRAVLEPCLRALAEQDFDARQLEVLVTFNGGGEPPTWPADAWPFELIVQAIDEAHIGKAKNAALDVARGDWVVLLNDDVIAAPDFLCAHLAAHESLDTPAMVLGESAWKRYDDETIFDRLIQTTSMVFFYDQLRPHQWYNFRHAWNLNLSLRRDYFENVRFADAIGPVNFDDIEWAFRIEQRYGLRVWYAPEARQIHDHRYTLSGYLDREAHLGRMAVKLWGANPECFRAIYGCDLDERYLDYARQYVQQESRLEREHLARFAGFVEQPTSELPSDDARQRELIELLYHAHRPLKRMAFRRGLLEAAAQHMKIESEPPTFAVR